MKNLTKMGRTEDVDTCREIRFAQAISGDGTASELMSCQFGWSIFPLWHPGTYFSSDESEASLNALLEGRAAGIKVGRRGLE